MSQEPLTKVDISVMPDLVSTLRVLLSIAFVLTLPLLIIGTNLRALVSDPDLMLDQFRQNGVALTTGLDDVQMQRVANELIAYFSAPPGKLDITVTLAGQTRPLFNQKEIDHMEDVQALIQTFLKLQLAGAVVAIVRLLVAFFERSSVNLGRDLLLGAALMVVMVLVVGALAAIDFSWLWTQFHKVAFRNDLWMLDPNVDYLIMLFPEPAWYAYTIRMVAGVAGMMAVSAAAGFGLWRWGR